MNLCWFLSGFVLAYAMPAAGPVFAHLFDAGLGTVSEIFEAEPPHLPGGAPSQAWSIACVIEAWWRLQRVRAQV